jgi:hypothetical protein
MAIFNSYVSLPEGSPNEMQSDISGDLNDLNDLNVISPSLTMAHHEILRKGVSIAALAPAPVAPVAPLAPVKISWILMLSSIIMIIVDL